MSYIKTFFLSTFILLVLFVGLIWSIDPYNRLGNNVFNFETKAVAQSRENKFYQLESSQKKYSAFILGSSAAHRYPTQVVNELTGYITYNYAVQHSTPMDYLAQTKHIINRFQPKLILMQLDFAGFDQNYKVDNRLFNSPLKKYLREQKATKVLFNNDLFTLDALRDSLRVIFVNLFGKARHIYLEDGNYIYEERKKTDHIKIKQSTDPNYDFAYDRLDIIRDIIDLCNEKNIKLIIFTSPLSLNHLKIILDNPKLKAQHDIFITELQKLSSSFFNFQTEDISKYSNYLYFHNSSHPTQELSEIVLRKILIK